MEALYWTIGIVVVGLIIYAVISLTSTRIVPQGQALVVYRLGQFHRIVGPGLVQLTPGLDVIDRVIEVRDHPVEVAVPGLFAFGAPNDLTLNLWCRFDPKTVAQNDRAKMAQFVQISDIERRQQIEVKIRDALVHQLAKLEQHMPLPANSKLMDGVAALAPGSQRHNALLDALKPDLSHTLLSLGMVLNTDHPIVVIKRSLSDEIVEAIKRRQGRDIDREWLTGYADELRQRFPELSNVILAQILSSIKGIDAGKVQRLLLEQSEGSKADVEFQMSDDGPTGTNVVTHPKPKPAPPSQKERQLTKNDLDVLKRLPREEKAA
jgi:hypothetical protein